VKKNDRRRKSTTTHLLNSHGALPSRRSNLHVWNLGVFLNGLDLLKGLDLFSGIGGISLALSEWVQTAAYCEIEPYCQGVLLSRMADGNIENAPIWDDITTLKGSDLPPIDIIFGGFPCTDISCAGRGAGLEGKRSGLFFEIVRLAKEIKPKFLFLENVPAITTRGGLRVVRTLAEMGYDCRWCTISAASVGALHKRERWFLLAHAVDYGTPSNQDGGSLGERTLSGEEQSQQEEGIGEAERTSELSSYVAHANLPRCREQMQSITDETQDNTTLCQGNDGNTNSQPSQQADPSTEPNTSERNARRGSTGQYWPFESREHWQEAVSTMGKCSDGLSHHVARLRSLGNSVVPIQVKTAFKILMGINET
jgi:DNA (cytosine-5)-methyltransferase 1